MIFGWSTSTRVSTGSRKTLSSGWSTLRVSPSVVFPFKLIFTPEKQKFTKSF